MAIGSGPYAARPGSHALGDIWIPNDSFWDYLVSDGSQWQHMYGGFRCKPPVASDFAWINQGGATEITSNGGMYVHAPASATANLRIRAIPVPPSNHIVTAIILPNVLGGGLGGAGFGWHETSSGKVETFGIADFSVVPHFPVYRNASPTTDGTLVADVVPETYLMGDLIPIQMENDGTNLIYRYSGNFVDWNVLLSHSIGSYFDVAPDRICFVVSARSSSFDVGATLIHWDLVGALVPPRRRQAFARMPRLRSGR